MISRSDTLQIKSRADQLATVRGWVAEKAQAMGFSADEVYALKLAVTEACANAIRHSYDGSPDCDIVLSIRCQGARFELTIQDFGDKFDFSQYVPPDLQEPSEGGYGVFLILKLMDEVEYDTSAPKGNVLRLVKYRAEQAR